MKHTPIAFCNNYNMYSMPTYITQNKLPPDVSFKFRQPDLIKSLQIADLLFDCDYGI